MFSLPRSTLESSPFLFYSVTCPEEFPPRRIWLPLHNGMPSGIILSDHLFLKLNRRNSLNAYLRNAPFPVLSFRATLSDRCDRLFDITNEYNFHFYASFPGFSHWVLSHLLFSGFIIVRSCAYVNSYFKSFLVLLCFYSDVVQLFPLCCFQRKEVAFKQKNAGLKAN